MGYAPVAVWVNPYSDVAGDTWYYDAVGYASENGLLGGYGNGMFSPNDNITREQLAVMLWRYAGSPAATDKELHFTDADKASGYALDALRWAVENGVMGGQRSVSTPGAGDTGAGSANAYEFLEKINETLNERDGSCRPALFGPSYDRLPVNDSLRLNVVRS